MSSTFREYYLLTKPGIIRGNAITAAAGFFLASRGNINIYLFISMIVGLSLVIASACVFNNYIDRDIDKKMDRTKNRAFVTKTVSVKSALIFGVILGLLGIFVLAMYVNLITTLIAAIGFFFYVVLYTFAKRETLYATEIGSISGAVPPVVGYTAVTGRLDAAALILFLILVFWQMPHFYSIAIYRLKDYTSAKIPVLPSQKGILNTKIRMILYIVAFIAVTSLLTFFGYTGRIYLLVTGALGLFWLLYGITGFRTKKNEVWAKKMFFLSLSVITFMCIMISVDAMLPKI